MATRKPKSRQPHPGPVDHRGNVARIRASFGSNPPNTGAAVKRRQAAAQAARRKKGR